MLRSIFKRVLPFFLSNSITAKLDSLHAMSSEQLSLRSQLGPCTHNIFWPDFQREVQRVLLMNHPIHALYEGNEQDGIPNIIEPFGPAWHDSAKIEPYNPNNNIIVASTNPFRRFNSNEPPEDYETDRFCADSMFVKITFTWLAEGVHVSLKINEGLSYIFQKHPVILNEILNIYERPEDPDTFYGSFVFSPYKSQDTYNMTAHQEGYLSVDNLFTEVAPLRDFLKHAINLPQHLELAKVHEGHGDDMEEEGEREPDVFMYPWGKPTKVIRLPNA